MIKDEFTNDKKKKLISIQVNPFLQFKVVFKLKAFFIREDTILYKSRHFLYAQKKKKNFRMSAMKQPANFIHFQSAASKPLSRDLSQESWPFQYSQPQNANGSSRSKLISRLSWNSSSSLPIVLQFPADS